MHGVFRQFVTFVGRRTDAHPSFSQAYDAGVLLSWVNDWSELRTEMRSGRVSDLIIFDTKYQSEEQCALCRALVSSGYRVLCIGCSGIECFPCHVKERDLLTAILTAVASGTWGGESLIAQTTNK